MRMKTTTKPHLALPWQKNVFFHIILVDQFFITNASTDKPETQCHYYFLEFFVDSEPERKCFVKYLESIFKIYAICI